MNTGSGFKGRQLIRRVKKLTFPIFPNVDVADNQLRGRGQSDWIAHGLELKKVDSGHYNRNQDTHAAIVSCTGLWPLFGLVVGS